MLSILARASGNFLLRHPGQLLLAILGIALGVAVVVAIDLAMESAFRAFDQASRTITGKASHKIIGSTGALPETLYAQLRVNQGMEGLSPVVEATVATPLEQDLHLRLTGIDAFALDASRLSWGPQQSRDRIGKTFSRLFSEANTVLISRELGNRLHLGIGDHLPVITSNGVQQLLIVDFLNADNALSRQALEKVLLTDIATAQELLAMTGILSAIAVHIDAADRQASLHAIQSRLPTGYRLISSESEQQSMRQMTRAFSINLQALGLLSLLVGMFLIYNTMTFLVVQRRPLLGGLRAIGVTRREIFRLILSEACVLALLGTSIGLLLGIAIGQGLLQLIAGTIDAIYFDLPGAALLIGPWQIVKGILLGFTATIAAAVIPAWEATRTPPHAVLSRIHLESRAQRISVRAGTFGALLLATGLLSTLLDVDSITLGLASIFLLLLGFALLTPTIILLLMRTLELPLGRLFGIPGKLPPRMVAAEISRTGIAVAALMMAVAATIGMDLMINSFRQTVSQWIATSLRADFYVALAKQPQTAARARSDSQLKQNLAALPGVQMLSSVLHTHAMIEDAEVPLAVFELNDQSRTGFILQSALHDQPWKQFEGQPTVLVTEAYAWFTGSKTGDRLTLKTPAGKKTFTVIGIYSDFSGDRGHIAMSRNVYRRYWPPAGYSGIGVYARPGANPAKLENSLRQLLGPRYRLRSNRAIYQASMAIFEQTFLITESLRWLAAGIAFVGIFSALMALQFERTRQLGVLRAIGMTPGQLSGIIITETGLMGLVAGVFAIPVGLVVALLLIFVIYQRSFGWTMSFYLSPEVFYQGLALAVLAALLAGIIPAWKMARTNPAEALRSE